jgi:hypothetical protein
LPSLDARAALVKPRIGWHPFPILDVLTGMEIAQAQGYLIDSAKLRESCFALLQMECEGLQGDKDGEVPLRFRCSIDVLVRSVIFVFSLLDLNRIGL